MFLARLAVTTVPGEGYLVPYLVRYQVPYLVGKHYFLVPALALKLLVKTEKIDVLATGTSYQVAPVLIPVHEVIPVVRAQTEEPWKRSD